MKLTFALYSTYCILIIFLNGCGTSSNAYLKSKNPNIVWMDKKAVKKKREFPTQLAYHDENFLYCYGYGNKPAKGISIMGFSSMTRPKEIPIFYQIDKNTMAIVKSSKEVKKEKFDYIDRIVWTSKAAWILFTENPNKKTKEFKAVPISLDKIETAKDLFSMELERKNNFVQDGYGFNSDSSKITYFAEIYESKTDKLSFMTICFDFVTMEKIWQKEYAYPYPVKKRSDIDDIEWNINKNGEAQFLLKTYFNKRKEKVKADDGTFDANYNFKFYVLTMEGKVEEYTIENKGDFVRSIEFPNTKTKNPVVCAYTYTKNNFKELKGIIIKQIDLDSKSVHTLKDISFNTKKIAAHDESTGKEIKQRSSMGALFNIGKNQFTNVANLNIRKVILTEDNSTYILGENNYQYERCNTTTSSRTGSIAVTTTMTTRCIPYIQSGNILITKLSADGSEAWSTIIPKSQDLPLAMGDAYSFASFEIDNKIHLFFNDHPKNYKSANIKSLTVWNPLKSKTSFVHVIVNPDGTYEMIEALGRKDHPKYVSRNTVTKIDNDHVLLFDTKTLGVLTIDR